MGVVRRGIYEHYAIELEPPLYNLAETIEPDFGSQEVPRVQISRTVGEISLGGQSVFRATWKVAGDGGEDVGSTSYSLERAQTPHEINYTAALSLLGTNRMRMLRGAVLAVPGERFKIIPSEHCFTARRYVSLYRREGTAVQLIRHIPMKPIVGSRTRPLRDDCELCTVTLSDCAHETESRFWESQQYEWDVYQALGVVRKLWADITS